MFTQISEQEIHSILRIPPRFRTQRHIQTLTSITNHIIFFQKISQEYNSSIIHEKCCEAMTLEEYNTSDTIINFGELGDKFYIILKGSVSIMVPTTKTIKVKASEAYKYEASDQISQVSDSALSESSEDLETFVLPDKRDRREGVAVVSVSEIIKNLQIERKSMMKKKSECEELVVAKLFTDKFKKEKKEIVKIVKECDNEFIEIEVSQLETVNVLKEGGAFGELALMSDRPRAATVVANERVSLLVIHKNSFRKILGNVASDRLLNKVKFLQSLPFFSSWTKSAIGKISVYFEILTFQRNQIIFAEGQEAKDLFFIKEGEVLLVKQQKVASGSTLMKNQKVLLKNKELRLCLKGKGESVGGYEIFNGLQTRVFGSVCYSTAVEVFVIRKDNLMNRIPHVDAIAEAISVDNQRLDDRLREVTGLDLCRVGERTKSKSISPLNVDKELNSFYAFDRPSMRVYGTCRNSPGKIVKSHSREITKAEISRAVNPKSMKIAIKPRAVFLMKVRKTPPPNFMLRSRTGSRIKVFK